MNAVAHFDAPSPVTTKLAQLLGAASCTRSFVFVGFGPTDPHLSINDDRTISVSNNLRCAAVPRGLTYKQIAEWVTAWAARTQPEIPDGHYREDDIKALPDGEVKSWLTEIYHSATSAYPLGGAIKVTNNKVEAWGYYSGGEFRLRPCESPEAEPHTGCLRMADALNLG